ncbi:MAG: serine/threonine protein phosphatase [Phycisphaerae bacterium]|nr:serine/threonine protein phosphatase [Phycisphaerae bacterium]
MNRHSPIVWIASALFALTAIPATAAAAEQLGPAPDGTFSIVVIPDTQAYQQNDSASDPNGRRRLKNVIFRNHVRWIIRNLETQKIVFVTHVGDIVDVDSDQQWKVAKTHMDTLRGKVPFGISPGNHDMRATGDSSLFQKHFPADSFAEFPWYAGCYPSDKPGFCGNNANSCQLFSAGGMDFIFLHLECNAPDRVLEWADDLLTKHADRKALITTHMVLGPIDKPVKPDEFITGAKGWMKWHKRHRDGNSAEQMWDKLFRKHANVGLIFCGDQSRTQALHDTRTADYGNRVHALLSDYGTGGLRVVRFAPDKNVVEVRTIDSATGELILTTDRVPNPQQHQFELPYQMNAEQTSPTTRCAG